MVPFSAVTDAFFLCSEPKSFKFSKYHIKVGKSSLVNGYSWEEINSLTALLN